MAKKWFKYHIKAKVSDLLFYEDMLRYDSCHFEEKPKRGQVEADVFSPHKPTIGRWSSFQISVNNVQRCIAPSFPVLTVIREPDFSLKWIGVDKIK